MRQIGSALGVLAFVFCVVAIGPCEEQPQSVTVCQLKSDPPSYNHKLVEVTGFVSHDFEDFTLFDPTCPSWPAVWLEYGGTAKSGTMYCCGVTADRNRPQEMVLENIPIPLVENDQFREFDKQIQPPFRSGRHGSIVRATAVGRFFAGRQVHYPKTTFWGGYGHMGCCSLLAIQEIKSVSSQDRDDLDYGASPDQPNIDKTGCGYRELTPIQPASDLIHAQQEADLGNRDWVFDDPQRVASDALAQFAHVEERSISGLKETRKAQGRYVYEWSPSSKAGPETYTVVASRPYLLSFYAHDAKRVAWVVAAAYVSSCGQNNAVTRIK
jgi:hypothetical protein